MNLDKRQKVIIALIVLAVIVLIWQVSKLMDDNNPTVAVANTTTKVAPSANDADAANAVKVNTSETAALLANSANNTASSAAPNVTDNDASNSQEKYLELVNEYQMAEIQKMIAQDQADIAKSRADAAQSLSDITKLTGNTNALGDIGNINQSANNPNDYELIYTGEDNGEWTATLKKNGQFNDVTAGTTLPDGAKVLSVDDNGVLLQQGANKTLVTFNGSTPMNSDNNQSTTTSPDQSSAPATSNLQQQLTPAPAATTTNKPVVTTVTTQSTAHTVAATKPTVVKSNTVPLKEPNLAAASLPKSDATNVVAQKTAGDFDIASANKDHYTVQMIADNQITTVNSFITKNALQTKAAAVKTMRNGKPWYIVVYGDFPSVAAASAAVQQLPKDLRSEKPFIRKVADVQGRMVK